MSHSSQAAPLLAAHGVGMTFGSGALATPVLHGVDLAVRPGELVLLSGPSGSGKTTLVSILAGLVRPTRGDVELCGQRLAGLGEGAISRIRRQHVGFVFQTDNLFPALTALDNVIEILRLRGLAELDARARALAALERVGLGHRLGYRPGQLSGGQRQRVAIARALAGTPRLLIGDEITAALDGETAQSIMQLVRDFVDRASPPTAALIVTHDHRLERFADRLVRMEDGRVVADERLVHAKAAS